MSEAFRKELKRKGRRKHSEMKRRKRAADDSRARKLLAKAAKRKLRPTPERSPPAKRQALRSHSQRSDDDEPQWSDDEEPQWSVDDEPQWSDNDEPQWSDNEERNSESDDQEHPEPREDVLGDDEVENFQFTSFSDDFNECDDTATVAKGPVADNGEALARRAASRLEIAEDLSDIESGEPPALVALRNMVEEEERDVARRDLASTSTALDKKAAVPSAAVRIADVGIVRLPEHGRSGRLMRHLKPYPGVGTSTCWNAVQNWTRYVCITVYYTVS